MFEFFGPNILIILPILSGIFNLFTPFISKDDSYLRSKMLIGTSIVFLLNIIILNYLYYLGVSSYIKFTIIGFIELYFTIEPLGLIFLSLISILWICALLYTIKYLPLNNIYNSDIFLLFVNASILCGSLVALSGNLFTMFIFYELLTIVTIPLIAHYHSDKTISGVSNYLKILMISSLTLFLPAIIYIYSKIGHNNFILNGIIADNLTNLEAKFLILFLIFGISKTAIFPLHNWLPSAMVASYPVSALLHAVVVVKTGLFCIFKILIYIFGINYLKNLFEDFNWLLIFPLITIIYSSFKAIRAQQVKMILAYSTINQLNIALLSAFMFTSKGMIAAVIHMVSHGFTKITLFYSAGAIYSVKAVYKVNELIGSSRLLPKTSLVFLLAGLSLVGIPPLAGFMSKFYIIMAAAESNNYLVLLTLIFSTIFSAIYISKILIFIFKPIENEYISKIKLKPYFEKLLAKKNIENYYKSKLRTEKKIPKLIKLSLIICSSGIVGFFFIQLYINLLLNNILG